MKAIICVGISGSGKTTWAEQFVRHNPSYLNINRDDIRIRLYGQEKMYCGNEDTVTSVRDKIIETALASGKNIIISDTNLNKDRNKKLEDLILQFDSSAIIEYKIFEVALDTCIERDKLRSRQVGENVIRRQFRQFKEFMRTNPVYRKQDETLPKCVLVDIDGTVALMNGRKPYDWHRVGEDSPNVPVVELVKTLSATYKVVFLSGRDSVCRPETEDWLHRHFDKNKIDYHLYMRPEKDNRNDSIVKKELFEQHVDGKWFVQMVFDDRLQVCRLWYSLGLPLVRVGDPDADF